MKDLKSEGVKLKKYVTAIQKKIKGLTRHLPFWLKYSEVSLQSVYEKSGTVRHTVIKFQSATVEHFFRIVNSKLC